jgi:hypothetical protein
MGTYLVSNRSPLGVLSELRGHKLETLRSQRIRAEGAEKIP